MPTINDRVNLYKLTHKYLRIEIGDTAKLAGSTDFNDETERHQFVARFKALTELLHDHAMREETYIHPLLKECKNKALTQTEKEHQSLEQQITLLTINLEKIENQQTAYQFYLDLTQFYADYLQHLISEERLLLPELQKQCSDDQLNIASKNILADMPKEAMISITKGMLTAINHPERAHMFKAMKAGMPPAVFAHFLSLASDVLQPEQMQKLCLALDDFSTP